MTAVCVGDSCRCHILPAVKKNRWHVEVRIRKVMSVYPLYLPRPVSRETLEYIVITLLSRT